MKEKLEQIKAEAVAQIQAADVPEKLNDVRVKFLGKKGELTAVLKGMKDVAPEDRPKVGQMVNDARAAIEALLEESKTKMERAIREQKMKEEVIDVTLPSKKNIMGHRHPNTIALEEVERIFVGMGYEVVEGPEVEYDEYNFEKLNIPADHPAKDEQDTFYINKEIVLRTQTSPVQARIMEQGKLPIRMIAPGRVFRSDEVDATHSPSFHQIEGPGDRQEYFLCRSERNAGSLCKRTVRAGYENEIPPAPFPVHGAQCRGGCKLLQMRRQRMPFLQGIRMDRDPGMRNGPSSRARDVRHRSGSLRRICIRRGPGAYRASEI